MCTQHTSAIPSFLYHVQAPEAGHPLKGPHFSEFSALSDNFVGLWELDDVQGHMEPGKCSPQYHEVLPTHLDCPVLLCIHTMFEYYAPW